MDNQHFDNPVYLTAFTGNPLAYLNMASNANRGRATTTLLAGTDPMSLNNGRVINRLSSIKKNVNSERDKQASAAAYLDNDEDDQDTLSSKGW